jgi:hypothetical protein
MRLQHMDRKQQQMDRKQQQMDRKQQQMDRKKQQGVSREYANSLLASHTSLAVPIGCFTRGLRVLARGIRLSDDAGGVPRMDACGGARNRVGSSFGEGIAACGTGV